MREFLRQLKSVKLSPDIILFDFFKTLLIYLISTAFSLCVVGMDVISDNIFGVYMLGVAVTSVLTSGYLWGILSSIGGVVAVNFLFTYPYFALNFSIAGYPVTFALLLLMSVLTSALTTRVKKAAILSATRERRAENLVTMSNSFLSANTLDKIMEITVNHFFISNQCSVIAYLGTPTEPDIRLIRTTLDEHEAIFNSPLELQLATSAYTDNAIYGISHEPQVQNCRGTYLPIATEKKVYGVIGLLFEDPDSLFLDTIKFAGIMISQTILALERQAMEEKAQKILLEKEKEKMRSNLLRAVSHDLRTPLTGILGTSATLMENKSTLDEQTVDAFLLDIHHDAEWLIHMVENLLSVTKISSDDATVKKQDEIVEEVVSEAVSRVKKRFPNAIIHAYVPDELLLVPMDAILIEQVLINLLENAIRHAESNLPISLQVTKRKNNVLFKVSDSGKGIDPGKIGSIFDGASADAAADSTRGLGIGLSICKTIILAHKGLIFAQNSTHGGATFTFVLPMKGELDAISENENINC